MEAQLPTHLLVDIAILLFYKDGCSHSLGHTQTALRPAARSVLHQNDADSSGASQPTLTSVSTSSAASYTRVPLGWAPLPSRQLAPSSVGKDVLLFITEGRNT